MRNEDEIRKLKTLTNSQLFDKAQIFVGEETDATLMVLHVLKEIGRRRAYAEKSYPSLIEFCVSFLGYKRDAAYRRILAMRALKDLPEIEEKIQSGVLTLTAISQAQTYFDQKKKANETLNQDQKREVILAIENKSTREVEKMFLELSPEEAPRERIRAINPEMDELRIGLPKRVSAKLEEFKSLLGPEKSSVETIEALERALDLGIAVYKKKAEKSARVLANHEEQASATADSTPKFRAPGKSISVHIKRRLWARDQGRCAFLDPLTHARCSATHHLEIDHIEARALGGSNELSNLRLLCRAHNQYAAIRQFGLAKMEKWVT
jgi:hypothetical protein